MADAPLKNLEYYVSRLNGYQKNTVYIQPDMFQRRYTANDHKITFKLPQNAIIDLHTLCLSYDLGITTNGDVTGGATTGAFPPRFTACQIRRLDIMMGGMQVGLSNLPDYGAAYSLTVLNKLGINKMNETCLYENGIGSADTMVFPGSTFLVDAGGTQYFRQHITSFLGILEGGFMRFLDTNLLPDVSIQITLASNTTFHQNVFQSNQAAKNYSRYSWSNVKMFAEVVRFGDNAYEKMVEARLSTGDPIMIPFTNWAMTETTSEIGTTGSTMVQCTVTTQSLDRLWGTLRAGDYDTQQSYGVTDINGNGVARAMFGPDHVQNYYYRFCSHEYALLPKTIRANGGFQPDGAATAEATVSAARYQFEVDSKLYPQFLADSSDCYFLMKNALDYSAMQLDKTNVNDTAANWAGQSFALVTSFEHNTGESNSDGRLISGLNTMGSNLPIVFKANNLTLPPSGTNNWMTTAVRPTIFAEMTSSLLIYPGRVISVVN